MDLLVETITAITVVAVDHHLATIGLLLRPVDAPDVETSVSITPPPAPVFPSVASTAPVPMPILPSVANIASRPAPVVPIVASAPAPFAEGHKYYTATCTLWRPFPHRLYERS